MAVSMRIIPLRLLCLSHWLPIYYGIQASSHLLSRYRPIGLPRFCNLVYSLPACPPSAKLPCRRCICLASRTPFGSSFFCAFIFVYVFFVLPFSVFPLSWSGPAQARPPWPIQPQPPPQTRQRPLHPIHINPATHTQITTHSKP